MSSHMGDVTMMNRYIKMLLTFDLLVEFISLLIS